MPTKSKKLKLVLTIRNADNNELFKRVETVCYKISSDGKTIYYNGPSLLAGYFADPEYIHDVHLGDKLLNIREVNHDIENPSLISFELEV